MMKSFIFNCGDRAEEIGIRLSQTDHLNPTGIEGPLRFVYSARRILMLIHGPVRATKVLAKTLLDGKLLPE